MQVNSVADHVSHAVLGGGEAIDFSISQSAEFFQILSSTLYSDQPLAVVRETICNAWDAHVEGGITDKAIEITLTDDKMTIKDFGKGIAHGDMGRIYGTYGNSTKKNDGMQTGGFGLGCKAPFAYTDHFEVTSCHAGTRTIYRLTKSSAEIQGKPGIIPMVSMPCGEESGLTVSINLKSGSDALKFKELLMRIVANGGIKATYNGSLMRTIDFSRAVNGYMIVNESPTREMHPLYVRYGNVIYPIPKNEAYRDLYDAGERLVSSISNYWKHFLVLQAPPHSISVTPSRESLSMQTHTIKTLKELLTKFQSVVKEPMQKHCFAAVKEEINKVVKTDDFTHLLHLQGNICQDNSHSPVRIKEIVDVAEIASTYMRFNYPSDKKFRYMDIKERVDALIRENRVDRGLLQSWFKEYTEHGINHHHPVWMTKKIIAPVVTEFMVNKIPVDRLMVVDNIRRDNHQVARNYRPRSISSQLLFIRKVVVVSYTKNIGDFDTRHRISKFPAALKTTELDDFFLFVLPRGVKYRDKLLDILKHQGFNLIDLTVAQPWERQDIVKIPEKIVTVKREGLVALSNASNHRLRDIKSMHRPKMLLEPRTLCMLENDKYHSMGAYIKGIRDNEVLAAIVYLFGNRIGVAMNSTQAKAWEKRKSLPTLVDFLTNAVVAEMTVNKRLHSYGENTLDKFFFNYTKEGELVQSEFQQILDLPMYNHLLPKPPKITAREENILILWEWLCELCFSGSSQGDSVDKVRQLAEQINKPADFTELHKFYCAFVDSRTRGIINVTKMLKIFNTEPSTSPLYQRTKAVLELTMKGLKK